MLPGNLAIAVNDISSFLGGPDFFAAVRQGGIAQMSGVNTGTALLNQKLAQFKNGAPLGTRLELYPFRTPWFLCWPPIGRLLRDRVDKHQKTWQG